MTTRQDVANEARSWVGTPFHDGASLKGVGVDCIGLIVGVGRELGLLGAFNPHAPEYRGYGRLPNQVLMFKACDEFLDRTTSHGLGDILVLRFEKEAQHFAIISEVDPQRIVHSYTGVDRVTEQGVNDLWRSRIARAYRFRGLLEPLYCATLLPGQTGWAIG